VSERNGNVLRAMVWFFDGIVERGDMVRATGCVVSS